MKVACEMHCILQTYGEVVQVVGVFKADSLKRNILYSGVCSGRSLLQHAFVGLGVDGEQ
jgi:hypothetical protein